MHWFIAFMPKFLFYLHDFHLDWMAAPERQEIRLCKSLCYAVRCLPYMYHFCYWWKCFFLHLRMNVASSAHSVMTVVKYITRGKGVFLNYMHLFISRSDQYYHLDKCPNILTDLIFQRSKWGRKENEMQDIWFMASQAWVGKWSASCTAMT